MVDVEFPAANTPAALLAYADPTTPAYAEDIKAATDADLVAAYAEAYMMAVVQIPNVTRLNLLRTEILSRMVVR